MRFVNAFFASAVEVGPDGRFFVLGGGIGGIVASSPNGVLPAMAVLARIHFDQEECGRRYRFRLTTTRPDGQDGGIEYASDFDVAILPHFSHLGRTFNFYVTFYGLNLPSGGMYTFNFFVDDHKVGQTELAVAIDAPDKQE